MKTFIQKLLIPILMLSIISPVIAISSRKSLRQTEVAAKALPKEKQTNNHRSFKAKALTVLGAAAAGVVACVLWKITHDNDHAEWKKLSQFEEQLSNPNKKPLEIQDRFMEELRAHNHNFRRTMQDSVSQANIEALFNNTEFIALLNNDRWGQNIQIQVDALFNDERILEAARNHHFVRNTIDFFNGKIAELTN